MAKKKKITLNTRAFRILLATTGALVLAAGYYLLEASLPDSFVETAAGPSFLGRRFSVLAFIYNTMFAVVAVAAVYYFVRWSSAKKSLAAKKRAIVVGIGTTRYKRRHTVFQGTSIVIAMALVGLFGTLTSEPSNALSTTTQITMKNITFTKMSGTHSPTKDTKYLDGKKTSNGKVIDTMQAGATDGRYVYFAYERAVAGGIIAKFDMDGKLIAKSSVYKPSKIGHANGMTYNSRLNLLVLSVWRPDVKTTNRDKVAFIDPSTLKIIRYATVTPKATVTNLCYNAATNQYVSNGRLYDANLQLVNNSLYSFTSTLYRQYGDQSSLGQGIACDSQNIYVIRYYPSSTKPHTHIYVFNWSGKLTGVYNVKGLKDETESLFILGGRMYAGINNGSAYLGKSSDNKKDYFVRLNGIPLAGISTN